jgi:3-hydroxyacyl-CoA dehydrogenase/enoyl-CoA hydratase/3-hydroxybutyryl-CoA epimerase
MPRLIGLEKSLDMILTGKTVDAIRAKKMGLVDKVVPSEYLAEKAVAWAKELAANPKKRVFEKPSLKEKLLGAVPGGVWLVCDQAKKQVMEKTQGNFPAPLAAIEVIRRTYGGSIEEGLKIEAEAFINLMVTPESQNLIHVFYLNERVKKDKGVEEKFSPRNIQRTGVVGAGVMGGGIAQLFAAKGARVRMKDVNWDAIAKGYQAAKKIFQKSVIRKKMKANELENAMARIEGTTEWAGFGLVDLVVEAAVENMEIKKSIFKELDEKVSSRALLATNTSSLSVTELAQATKHPERVLGMHFFNPVDKMPLVEVIYGEKTSGEAIGNLVSFAKTLGKTPIVVKDSPGFVVNRILGPYLNEAVHLLMEGVRPSEMDKLIVKFGMPMGPCALLDEVGLDVASKVSHVLYGAFGDRMKAPEAMETVVKEKRLGKKVGRGIYLYENGKRQEDDHLLSLFERQSRASDLTNEVIVRRLIYLMVNEASRCVEENLVRHVSDIDVGMIFGTGFAPFRGGLLRFADTVGAESIVSDLDIFVRKYGDRFKPSQLLQDYSVRKAKFYGPQEL